LANSIFNNNLSEKVGFNQPISERDSFSFEILKRLQKSPAIAGLFLFSFNN
jgi:hypothetical protein